MEQELTRRLKAAGKAKIRLGSDPKVVSAMITSKTTNKMTVKIMVKFTIKVVD